MESLAQNVLSNAAWALALALVAALSSRIWRQRPALVHGLWLLVLLKLVTPSLVGIGFPVSAPAPKVVREAIPPIVAAPTPAPVSVVATPGDVNPSAPIVPKVVRPLATAKPLITSETGIEATRDLKPRRAWPWLGILAAIWVSGVVVWSIAVTLDVQRFRRLFQAACPAPEGLAERVRQLGTSLGLRQVPSVWVVPARIPPMLWALAGPPKLLLPQELWERLDQDQRDAVLIHELAHLKRRDHWVRHLEAVVLGLYWWNPVAWWARREIEKVEEECCDAWVVWALPKSVEAYAEALVATAAYLAGPRPAWPLGATGTGRVPPLKQRLIMILRDPESGTILRPASRMALVLGVAALLLLPAWAPSQPPDKPESGETAPDKPKDQSSSAPAENRPAPKSGNDQLTQALPTPTSSEGGSQREGTDQEAKHQTPRSALRNRTRNRAYAPVGDKPSEAENVQVIHPLVRKVSDYHDFLGWIEPNEKVEIRTEVGGKLEKVLFKAGDIVKKGDTLFELNSQTFQVEATKALAETEHAKNRLMFAKQKKEQLARIRVANTSELEQAENDLADAQARLKTAELDYHLASLKLSAAKVTSPMTGKISRPLLAPGSIIAANVTQLATITSVDTMNVAFDIQTNIFQHVRQTILKGERTNEEGLETTAIITLTGQQKKLRAKVNLEDYEADPASGTYRMRVVIPNQDRTLMPGMRARVRLVIGEPYQALLIPYTSAQDDSVLVVNDKKIFERRKLIRMRIYGGAPYPGNWIVVEEGLSPGDWITVDRFEGVEGFPVHPEETTLREPTLFLDKPDAEASKPVEGKPETK